MQSNNAILRLLIIFLGTQTVCISKILRNNVLMSKMVADFHKDNGIGLDATDFKTDKQAKPDKVISLMQDILCKNFKSIPCSVIIQDGTLRKLIERSIRQINSRTSKLDRATPLPHESYLTLFPTINSEDLSSFLQVHNTGYFNQEKKTKQTSKYKTVAPSKYSPKRSKKYKYTEKRSNTKQRHKADKHAQLFPGGRKRIRKFYPHKIKYKDKHNKLRNELGGEISEEKLSMSVETPESPRNHQHFSFKRDDSPVWRIDYMKHGEPNVNLFGYDSDLKEKIMDTGPNVIMDEKSHTVRKDVLHTDVYIKKPNNRKNTIGLNSEGIE